MNDIVRVFWIVATVILFAIIFIIVWANIWPRPAGATSLCLHRPILADRSGYWRYRVHRSTGQHCWYQSGRGHRIAHRHRSRVTKTVQLRPDDPPAWLLDHRWPVPPLSPAQRVNEAFEAMR